MVSLLKYGVDLSDSLSAFNLRQVFFWNICEDVQQSVQLKGEPAPLIENHPTTTTTLNPPSGVAASTSWRRKKKESKVDYPLPTAHCLLRPCVAVIPVHYLTIHTPRRPSVPPYRTSRGLDRLRTHQHRCRKRNESVQAKWAQRARAPYRLHHHGAHPLPSPIGGESSTLASAVVRTAHAAAEMRRHEWTTTAA